MSIVYWILVGLGAFFFLALVIHLATPKVSSLGMVRGFTLPPKGKVPPVRKVPRNRKGLRLDG
jgi:hypothetical protein